MHNLLGPGVVSKFDRGFFGEGVLETIVGLEIVLCLFNLLHNVICLVNEPNRNIEKLPRNVLILSNPVVGHRQI